MAKPTKPEVNDPLEAAKIPAPAAPAPKAQAPAQAPAGGQEGASPASASPKVEEPDLPPPAAAPEPPKPVAYRVLNAVTLSWGGQFIRLRPGDEVQERHYGADGIERMRQGGVALERIE